MSKQIQQIKQDEPLNDKLDNTIEKVGITINNYNLDLSHSFYKINNLKPKRVLIQLPDGFKYNSKQILDLFMSRFPKTKFYCWLNTNFGSCDIPIGLDKLQFDLIIHFGHEQWR